MAESSFSALKNERVYRTAYATNKRLALVEKILRVATTEHARAAVRPDREAQARRDVIAYIEGFYNSRRRHSALGYKRPNEVDYGYTQPATSA